MTTMPVPPTATVTAHTLRDLRRVMGWTQPEAAAWAGIDLRTWRRWENGEKAPHGLMARALQSLPVSVQVQLHLY